MIKYADRVHLTDDEIDYLLDNPEALKYFFENLEIPGDDLL